MIQFPPMKTFNDGELQDGKKLAKKVLEESAELMVASQHDTREHMLDEVRRRPPDAGELLQVLRHHRQ
jgi:hypothetical protein